ncbi:MAG: hypothetical protein IPG76_12225 [Acidobacteria bacterium]|nr:hypothetical protein [Acidobacteriota bacterium]
MSLTRRAGAEFPGTFWLLLDGNRTRSDIDTPDQHSSYKYISGGKPRLSEIRAQYDRVPEPKELVILEGAAHAQFIFQTSQGDLLMREILRFLSGP